VRNATLERVTAETAIEASLALDATGRFDIVTGRRMLDHLLQQFAFHARVDLRLAARSLDGIGHHLVEDVAIVLGETVRGALGDRLGIERYGAALLPMDDALVRVAIDLGGRAFARVDLGLAAITIEDIEAEMVPHFLSTFATHARMALHVDRLAGTNAHHCVEAAFKALARACAEAWTIKSHANGRVPSTKSVLA
jgi:imidazoleglycerol-phosphate dehydratase